MIIGTYFDGDNDDKLKMIQHGSYYDLLREWILMAGKRRLRYRTSPAWTEITQLWEQFREAGTFDHRSNQMGHDLIAARFRQVSQELEIPDMDKEDEWYAFFKVEAAVWLEHDDFLRDFMVTLSAKGSTARCDAEESMFEMMRIQYTELIYTVSL
jgi:hypothetical protein